MNSDLAYISQVLNSTLRMTAPLLYAALAAALSNKVNIVNISMEGVMMAGAFFGIVVNYYTNSIVLAILGSALSGFIISAIVAFFIVKLKANAVVVGLATNTMMSGLTIYLMYLIFDTRGVFTDPSLKSLPRVNLPIIKDLPFIGDVLRNLTIIDYLAVVMAILIYIFLYKTVLGYRVRAVGINEEAAKSLGTNTDKYKFWVVSLSGILSGLAGTLLSMGTVTLFIQDITSGKGYIALAANSIGQSHPLGVLISTTFFGFSQSLGSVLQRTALKSQITQSIPYVATIVALVVYSIQRKRAKKRQIEQLKKE